MMLTYHSEAVQNVPDARRKKRSSPTRRSTTRGFDRFAATTQTVRFQQPGSM